MKRILLITALVISACVNVSAQFSVGFTNSANVLSLKLKAITTTTTGFSGIEFFLRYPTGSPAFSYGAITANTTNFPGMTSTGATGSGSWEIEHNNPNYVLPGYNVDHLFYTAPAPVTTSMTYNAGQEYDLISVPLVGQGLVNFQLVHQNTEFNVYLAITDGVGGDLRPAAFKDYFYPLTDSVAGPGGSEIYFSALTAPLPVKFVNFAVSKNNNTAVLNWLVENEDPNVTSYIIQKSTNGADFSNFASVPALNNGRSNNSYAFTVDKLSNIPNSGVIYFRVLQTNKDGNTTYTEIKNVRLSNEGIILGVYPNPIKSSANLSFELLQSEKVSISVVDALGKSVKSLQFQGFKGTNIKVLDLSNLASGNYTLKLQTISDVKAMPLVKVN